MAQALKHSVAVSQRTGVGNGPRWILLLPLLLVVGIFWFSPNFDTSLTQRQEPLGGDFLQEWVGGKIMLSDQRQSLYELEHFRSLQHDESLVGFSWPSKKYFPPVYPPFYYLLVSPFAMLSFSSAVFLWGTLSALAVSATGFILHRFYPPCRERFELLFLSAMIFVPLWVCFQMGHKSTFLLLILSSTFVLLHNERPLTAGLVFGLIAFKPHLALLIGFAMLFKQQWRFVAGAVLTAGALVGLSFLSGTELCSAYTSTALGMGSYVETGGYLAYDAHGLWGALQHLLSGVVSSQTVKVLALLGSLAVVVLLAMILKGPLQLRSPGFAIQFAALTIGTVLLSPHFYFYDLTILLLPLLLIGTAIGKVESATNIRTCLISVVAVLIVAAGCFKQISLTTSIQPSVILLVALLVLIMLVGRSERRVKPYPVTQG